MRRKTIRNSFISILALIIIFVAAGAAYTFFTGQAPPKQAIKPPPPPAAQPHEIKPPAPDPKARIGASVNSLTTPAPAGTNAALSVQTTAGATCSVSVVYCGVASTDSGLSPKKADAYGIAGWTWTVSKTAPAGSWPIKITCARNGKSAAVQTAQQVTR